MDKKLKAKWIKALRCGRYKQGNGALKVDNEYCCLGVLATIQRCKWNDGEPIMKNESVGHQERGRHFYLAPTFAQIPYRAQKFLGQMNDKGKTFKEIADYIAKQF